MFMVDKSDAYNSRYELHKDVNYLIPDNLETTNRIILETRGKLNLFSPPPSKRIAVAGYFFNKRTRTFHSHLVWGQDPWIKEDKSKKHRKSLDDTVKDIQKVLKESESLWSKGGEDLKQSTMANLIQKFEIVFKEWNHKNLHVCERELMWIYSHLPLATNEYLAGLLYSILAEVESLDTDSRNSLAFISADIILNAEDGYPTFLTPILWPNVPSAKWKEGQPIGKKHQIHPDCSQVTKNRQKIWEILSNHFYNLGIIKYLKQGVRKANKSEIGSNVLIIPVFDTWVEGRGYGGLWSVLICSFVNKNFRDDHIAKSSRNQQILRAFLEESERLADEYFSAGLVKLVQEDIFPPYDWIDLFVRRLHWIQDWERVTIVQKTQKGDIVRSCYSHFRPINDNIEWSWLPCNKGGDDCAVCRNSSSGRVFKWSYIEPPSAGDHPILNQELVKEISPAEINEFHNIDIEFEFPSTAIFPPKKSIHYFYLAIVRQHITALRTLLPVVRARRSAIRNAAVSIMARNMSHNIGSHVLACISDVNPPKDYFGEKNFTNTYWQWRHSRKTRLEEDLQKTAELQCEEDTDALFDYMKYLLLERSSRVQLIRYLQERMDFLAEAATSKFYMTVPAALQRVINEYNAQELMTSHITGIDRLTAKIQPQSLRNDLFFACSGGRLGQHALYVILENVIRNTAKHSENEQDLVAKKSSLVIKIKACNSSESTDLIEVLVWDLKQNGGTSKICKNIDIKTTYGPNRIEDNQSTENTGNFKKPLYQYLNEDVINKPIILGNGEIDPHNWGIREMLIAAAYLRQTDFENLESRIKPSLLTACLVNNNGAVIDESGSGNLGYKFYIRKPKEIVIIEKSLCDLTSDARDKLANKGVDIIDSLDELKMPVNYRFMVMPNKLLLNHLEQYPVQLIFSDRETKLAPALDEKTKSQFIEHLKQNNTFNALFLLEEIWQKFILNKHHINQDEIRLCHTTSEHGALGSKADNDNLDNAVIYDHHYSLLVNGKICDSKPLFWEPYNTPDPQYLLFHTPPETYKDNLEKQFLTAGLARIAILDERIQREVHQYHGITRGPYHCSMTKMLEIRRIYIPTRDEANLYEPDANKIGSFLDKIINTEALDFIVIHQGIIDRLLGCKEETSGNWIKRYAQKVEAHLVVCSGRGVPTQLVEGARFVPVSSVMRWVVHQPSKFHLFQLLCSSRGTNRE